MMWCIASRVFFLAVYFCSFLEKFGSEATLGTNPDYFIKFAAESDCNKTLQNKHFESH